MERVYNDYSNKRFCAIGYVNKAVTTFIRCLGISCRSLVYSFGKLNALLPSRSGGLFFACMKMHQARINRHCIDVRRAGVLIEREVGLLCREVLRNLECFVCCSENNLGVYLFRKKQFTS